MEEQEQKEIELEEEWWSLMSCAVCSIPLISPVGMPSPLHAADQLPLYIATLYLRACARGRMCLYASSLKPDRRLAGI